MGHPIEARVNHHNVGNEAVIAIRELGAPIRNSLKKFDQRLGCLIKNTIDPKWAAQHRVVYKTIMGFAVDEILQYANNDIDLIVVGTHGYSCLAHALIGSVAEKLVRVANCPVLAVHPQGHQFLAESDVKTDSTKKS